MVHLALHRVPVPGVPDELVLRPGDRCALVVPDRGQSRRLADAVAGLDDPPAGAVVDDGGGVRLVPAEGGLLPYLTVLENLVHGDRVSRKVPVPRRSAEDECRAAAGWFGLDDVLKRYPYEITPGRRRLAGLARALRGRPPAVVVLEDAEGLPAWGALLDFTRNPDLSAAALLLITSDPDRAAGFPVPGPDRPGGEPVGGDGDGA